jgi:uncharacterized membrane protein
MFMITTLLHLAVEVPNLNLVYQQTSRRVLTLFDNYHVLFVKLFIVWFLAGSATRLHCINGKSVHSREN